MPNSKFLLAFYLTALATCNEHIIRICSPVNPTYSHFYPNPNNYNWNLVQNFNDAPVTLGSGSFGLVKKVSYGIDGIAEVAIKRSLFADQMQIDLAGSELNVLKAISGSDPQIGPIIYGCQYSGVRNQYGGVTISELYIVQQLLSEDLQKSASTIRGWEKHEQLLLQIWIVRRLAALWKAGFQHADIKPDNIMLLKGKKDAVLIDFNLAQPNNVYRGFRGTPKFVSPGVISRTGYVSEMDDLFSWALTFAAVSNIGGIDGVWAGVQVSCQQASWTSSCADTLSNQVATQMANAGWGNYQNDQSLWTYDYINVNTIVTNIVRWNVVNWSFDTVAALLERNYQELIDPSLKKPLPVQQPVQKKAPQNQVIQTPQQGGLEFVAPVKNRSVVNKSPAMQPIAFGVQAPGYQRQATNMSPQQQQAYQQPPQGQNINQKVGKIQLAKNVQPQQNQFVNQPPQQNQYVNQAPQYVQQPVQFVQQPVQYVQQPVQYVQQPAQQPVQQRFVQHIVKRYVNQLI